MRNSVDFRCLTISTGAGRRELDQRTGEYRRKYVVTIKSDATGATRRFTFTNSKADERAGKVGLAGTDLLYAFRCFVDDGTYAEEGFANFADSLGYDQDSYSARQMFRACQAARRKFDDLFAGPVNPAGVLDELASAGIE